MWTQRFQKILSFFLIFFLLFSLIARVPLLQYFSLRAFAEENEYHDLVAIIVDENTYSEQKSKISRYSQDIQGVLENTKVAIFPTPSNASAFDIASLLEKLYFEGYKSLTDSVDFESRLVGTVLIGKIPVPLVFEDDISAKSILPYIDFEEKKYIFNSQEKKYIQADQSQTEIDPEIWHGVISPNTGDSTTDQTAIADYLNKNHDFYLGEGVFKNDEGALNGVASEELSEAYEPYVFYYDQFRETEALQYQKYMGYQMYLQNIEDITYNRYSKELAEKVKDQVLGAQNAEIKDLIAQVDPSFDMSQYIQGPDTSSSSDVLTRYITDNTTKKYLEIFNSSTLGDMRTAVYNAGRYNKSGSQVNVDIPPFLITVIDEVTSQVIKNVNTSLESEITNLVANGLSRKIPIGVDYRSVNGPNVCNQTYHNFYYGKIAQEITNASQCSIYRGSTLGSGTLVEANRGYNIELTEADLALCQGDFARGDSDASGVSQGYWSGNTPLNFNAPSDFNYSTVSLKNNTLTGAIRPIFDILGSKEITDGSKVPSPLDCYQDGTFLQTYQQDTAQSCSTDPGGTRSCTTICSGTAFQAPVAGAARAGDWSCRTKNPSLNLPSFQSLFDTYYISTQPCIDESYTLGTFTFAKRVGQLCSSTDSSGTSHSTCCVSDKSYTFKAIPSYILHTSPTDQEFGAQINALYTPSLPIDSTRYIDFIGAKGGSAPQYGYQRIDFPQFFDVKVASPEELDLEILAQKTKTYLDTISDQINTVIRNSDPSSLSVNEKKLYDAELKTGTYPQPNFDLYKILSSKPLEVYTLENQSKEISYFDTLVFAIYWNNLQNVSSKYKFIFENYLSNEFTGNDFSFALPKAKKNYEIGYFAAPGDAENMYVKLDPEMKGIHPYSDILSQNLELQGYLGNGYVGEMEGYEETFKCSPPDGVPIWEWIPAVICWLKDMLPPTIKISEGECGETFLNEEELQALEACQGDVNKNGVNDCIEGRLSEGSLVLSSDAGRYFYHSPGVLYTQLFEKDGKIASFDTISSVSVALSRLEIPLDITQPFGGTNIKVIYDASIPALATAEARKQADAYINFLDTKIRVSSGEAKAYFYGKGVDVNAYFQSRLEIPDADGNLVVNLKSETQKIEVRGDRLFINLASLALDETLYSISDSLVASDKNNICIINSDTKNFTTVSPAVQSLSEAQEKLMISVENYSQAGVKLPLGYPLKVQILKEGELSFEKIIENQTALGEVLGLTALKEIGRYTLKIEDSNGFIASRTFDVLPKKASSLELGISTNIIETGGNVSTHIVTLLDEFGNPASGEIYTLELSLEGRGLVFDANGEDKIQYNVVEGYKAFRLRSTEKADINSLTATLKDAQGNVIQTKKIDIETLADIRLEVTPKDGTPKVGGNSYRYGLRFTDEDGNTLTQLNSRAYMGVNALYGRSNDSYVSIVNGVGEVSFTTATLAARGIQIQYQLEGATSIFSSPLDIHPEAPVQVDLSLNNDKIEASKDATSVLQVILRDQYGNEVYTDSSTKVTAEVAAQSSPIIQFDTSEKTVQAGKAQFQISGTEIPGIGYFQVSTTPDLSKNSFQLTGQAPFDASKLVISGMKNSDGSLSALGKKFYREFSKGRFISQFSRKEGLEESEAYGLLSPSIQKEVSDFWNVTNALTIQGVGKNAGTIETFYFWGKEEIQGNAYNGLYSILAGANYGDITQKDYLAGTLLFDRNNSSLAVTSLLNSPYEYSDVLSLDNTGKISILQEGNLLQDIEMIPQLDTQGRIFFDVQNTTLSTYIGKLYMLLSDAVTQKLTLTPQSEYSIEEKDGGYILKNIYGQEAFSIDENGKIAMRYGLHFSQALQDTPEGHIFTIENSTGPVATLELSGDFKVNITRDQTVLENKLDILTDTFVFYLQSSDYSSRLEYQDDSQTLVKIYYHDPFADKQQMNSFHESNLDGLESVEEDSGIAWEERNAILLQFSSGEGVGRSTKFYQSFSLINLGDPVVSLKKKDFFMKTGEKKSFDPSVGKIIATSEDLIGYQDFDYNADGRQDIFTIHRDGYLKLYEGVQTEEGFMYHGSLAYAADGGASRMVKAGDFTGDSYDDIFFVTETGKPALLNNREKDFQRINLDANWTMSGSIVQAEVYDMDKDNKDDVVTLDSAGGINIFYGGGSSQNPEFTKKFVGDGYGITLSDLVINHGGAFYFDGLPQINPNANQELIRDAEAYSGALNAALANLAGAESDASTLPTPSTVDEDLLERFLYVQLPYIPKNYSPSTQESEILLEEYEAYIAGLTGTENEAALSGSLVSLEDFIDNYDEYVQYSGYENGLYQNTYFLRSQYANLEGLQIQKSYTDTTLPYLQTGDSVYLDISIKNTSPFRKNNVAYVESLPKYFQFADDSFTILSEGNKIQERRPSLGEYEIVLDGFYLDPGEEIKVRYVLKSLPLSYGHIQVGLYEDGELGDDIYGDIILKEDNLNCGAEADIFRSTSVRSYESGKTIPVCEEDAVDIGNTFPELSDTNNDGVPDYIENILDSTDIETAQEYADEVFEELTLDTDSDGIPDSDDVMDETESASDFMGALDQINEAVDEISEDIDEMIQGLSCGFGGGSCFANPLNWAPLAPGSAPTLMGMPLGPLTPNTGIPVFSALTGRQASCGFSPCCLPSVYPMSSAAFIPGPFCGPKSAGGSLGTWSSTNFVRLFVTPTLTGGAGVAVCFGGPAIAAGNANPMGVHPIVPGGNCIVAAMPLFGCEGGEGDPGSQGYPIGDDFGVIHANCDGTKEALYTPQKIEDAFVSEYLIYLQTGVLASGFEERYTAVMNRVYEEGPANFYLPSEPLINIGNGDTSGMSVAVDLDMSSLAGGNFQDVVQVKNKRIGGFPNFMMDWVERQLDEITSKLTNLPRIFVILPDFGGLFDFSWKDFGNDMDTQRTQQRQENDSARQNKEIELEALRAQKSSLDCSGNDSIACKTLDLQIARISGTNPLGKANETLSGIKEAYEFLGNIPLVNIETESISVNVPWIDPTELGRFTSDWKYSLEQWKEELENAKNAWSFGVACTQTDAKEKEACQKQNEISQKAYLDANSFINSLENNIQILEEYANFPEQLSKLINIKQVWLEQIMCNIEAIASLLGEWIGTNGERFKAWVELYILIKAILKSWQLFIDVFNGYEEECHECKNERQDLQTFVWRLISMVIPSPPIIQFPKWPDIILDLHNVRAGMTIYMPDFEMNLRPIVLPTLPQLHLPAVPSAEFELPELPTLPRFTLPELPELPTLPKVELPDLPPPPKIPELFGPVEAVLNIMKLVSKVMCILKNSPFVPEWRAGDQIAYLTERNGYLPLDFIDIQPPAFSYSAISAIKVSAYVNFEFDMEFIIEAVRAITEPLDKTTNNIVNMFDLKVSDIDFSGNIPENIDTQLELDGTINTDISLAPLESHPENMNLIVGMLIGSFTRFLDTLSSKEGVMLTQDEFKLMIAHELSSPAVTQHPETQELQNLWKDVFAMKSQKEDAFIEELQKNSQNKFDTLNQILLDEIEYTKKQQKLLQEKSIPDFIIQVSQKSDVNQERFKEYEDRLAPYNEKTLDAAIQLVSGPSEESKNYQDEIKAQGENMMQEVRGGLERYNQGLLAATTSGSSSPTGGGVCSPEGNNEYRYEGIYILEHGKNYRLFDYVDRLRGDETPTLLDVDNDTDTDILYMVNGTLYLKENTSLQAEKSYVSTLPLVLSARSNIFYSDTENSYQEALNYFQTENVSDGAINLSFLRPSNPDENKFRLTYNTIVDRYKDPRDTFIPESVQSHIVDAFAKLDEDIPLQEEDEYSISPHTASLDFIGAMNGLVLHTPQLQDISDELEKGNAVNITPGTPVYSGKNSFSLQYSISGEEASVNVPKQSVLRFTTTVKVQNVSDSAYVSLGVYEDIRNADILEYIGKPLFPGSTLQFEGNASTLSEDSHADIVYYDGTEVGIDFRKYQSYTLYDIGNADSEKYHIRMNVPNDYYYAQITPFSQKIPSTKSQQILLAPQTESDRLAPQLGLSQEIRIPVYQRQTIDLTPFIYEDGGISGIAEVRLDFNPGIDSDSDGRANNDSDEKNINIQKTTSKIKIDFGPYDTLWRQNIGITLIDDMGNQMTKEIPFEVYSPNPSIEEIQNDTIIGQIDEDLLQEPVRLYRYRGGVIEKLQKSNGEDLVETDADGNYSFKTASSASGVLLTHSGITLAEIDEYTGKIDFKNSLVTTRVLSSNHQENTSVYPEIQIQYLGEEIFRQFIKMPDGEARMYDSTLDMDENGVYVSLLDQENHGMYRIPLGVSYNPGSVSVYLSSDPQKRAIMTVFQDGRIDINRSKYRLEYDSKDDFVALNLMEISSGKKIANIIYHLDASYILR